MTEIPVRPVRQRGGRVRLLLGGACAVVLAVTAETYGSRAVAPATVQIGAYRG